jgi:polyisoprenyl-teichoic acid--peptidoglycan teichoic acid transferase
VVASLPPWRAFVRRYVIAFGLTFVLVVGALIVGNQVIDEKLSNIPRIGGLVLPEGPGQAGNFLIIGSDSRAGLDNAQAFGTEADTGPAKSDTLMIVHIDPDAKTSLLVSFPRDLIVNVPGHGQAQINSAFNDGPQKVIDTIKDNFNVDINHYVEVNFTAFIGIVDAVGKIPVYFQAPARDSYSGLNITTPGCVDLDGTQSLEYVRARHLEYYNSQTGEWEDASPRADLDRITRQQNFIRRLADVAARKSGSNPLTALEVADAIVPKLKIDEQLAKDDIFRLVNTFRKVNPNDDSAVEMLTIPVQESSTQAGRVVLKQPDADSVLARLRSFGVPKASSDSKVLPAQVRVRVLNASGVNGMAGTALGQFQKYSFAPAGAAGNAAIRERTEIHYRPGNEDKALLVARYMQGVGQVVADDSIVDADVVVFVAKDFKGVKKLTKKSLSTTTTTKAPKRSGTTGTTAPPATGC